MKKEEKKSHQPISKKNQIVQQTTDLFEKNYKALLAIILLISAVSFLPSLFNHSFVWDDEHYIQENLLLPSFDLKGIFSAYVVGNYHPLTVLVLAAEYQLFGLNVTGYHAVNLLFHLLNIILVFYAVRRLSNKAIVALVASLLFGIHPLHVESVAWASGLKDLLYTLFFLSGYILYLKYLHTTQKKYIHLALLLFLLSLLSKAMAVTLPVLLLLTDYFKDRKFNFKTLTEKIPFFLLAIIFGVVAIFAQESSGSLEVTKSVFTFFQRIAFACYGLITYFIKLVVPTQLSAYYPYPAKAGNAIPVIYYSYILFAALLAAIVFYSLRFSKKLLFGIGFFIISISLVLQLIPVGSAIMADRYTYLSAIGIFYLAGEGVTILWNKKQRLLTGGLLVLFSVFFSVKTYQRCSVWDNNLTLWNDVINQNKNVPIAYLNRGVVLGKEKKFEPAVADFNIAIALSPEYTKAYYNRGVAYLELGKPDLAIEDFSKTIELNPKHIQAYQKRASAYTDMRDFDKALNDFDKAIELDPGDANSYKNQGLIYVDLGKFSLANRSFSTSIQLNPEDGDAYYNRAVLYVNMQQYDRALSDFSKALKINPNDADSFLNRGNVYSSQKKYDAAMADYSNAIKINPKNGFAYYYRGLAAYLSGNAKQAVTDLRQAAALGNDAAKNLLTMSVSGNSAN